MAVYVDDMHRLPLGRLGRMRMSHMIADTPEELLTMALSIGLKEEWLQLAATPREHFDVSKLKRRLAVQRGAIEVTVRELTVMTMLRAKGLPISPPGTALERWRSVRKTRELVE